ncbi:Protein of unknown function [Lactobacillus helveticus CIRM-BIA 953]|uniref:Uncharacterized protein n=1 Tax=Lactobacillus helveticus CIRM-BIA 953 TaxID=1226335 RepID=U4QLX0_LACHE|nr:Protein of unknown function [Lactobacillus helveticus CIRM-BIA 953]
MRLAGGVLQYTKIKSAKMPANVASPID